MLTIKGFNLEGLESNIVTDSTHPRFSFYLESDKPGDSLKKAVLLLNNGYIKETTDQIDISYQGEPLLPFTKYTATLKVTDSLNQEAQATLDFSTGKLNTDFSAKWISDGVYKFTEKKVSPKVMTFNKKFEINKKVKEAKIYASALGLYRINLNDKKVGNRFLTPGFTSYKHNLQYQTYDVTDSLHKAENDLIIDVAGGWAIGSFVSTRANRVYHSKQALLLEMHIVYEDGSTEKIVSDPSFNVSTEGPYKNADIYDGVTYDSNVKYQDIKYHQAAEEKLGFSPLLQADYSSPVIIHETFTPVFLKEDSSKRAIFDFKQNFAGLIHFHIKNGKSGNKITIRHAEILKKSGDLDTEPLRTAKASIIYICKDGEQDFIPEFTYMGFRYISLEGINKDDIDIKACAIYSDVKRCGEFSCSSEELNKLNKNIIWSSKSNFVDIPTDCPQRDERMGWTGDISIFAPTGCFNFDLKRFLEKWLKDVKAEQLKTGGIPNTIPSHGYSFPTTMPKMAVDFWGDACLTVPYELYMAYNDKLILSYMYPAMKKYVQACKFWANIYGIGKYRYIWHTPSMLHFGDWVAPDIDKMSAWQKRSKYTATASLARTSSLLSKIAGILGYKKDEKKYSSLSSKVKKAYVDVFTDGNGKLKKEEFQTGYVLPLEFNMFSPEEKKKAVENLVRLVKEKNYCINTGFPGTPYILFVLADNGYPDVAYKMLMNTSSPSWLYNIKVGGTTVWEKFDGMLEDGTCRPSKDGTGNMISFNHYASGSVGQFLYQRIGGLEPISPGYKEFKIQPILGGNITSCNISYLSMYGMIESIWKIVDKKFIIEVIVPFGTICQLVLPNEDDKRLQAGKYSFAVDLK